MSRQPRRFLLQLYGVLVCFTICALLLITLYSECWNDGYAAVASSSGARPTENYFSLSLDKGHDAANDTKRENSAAAAVMATRPIALTRTSVRHYLEIDARRLLNLSESSGASLGDMQSTLMRLAEASYHRLTHTFAVSPLQCGEAPFLAVVVVQCLPSQSLRRTFIRQTWATEARSAGIKVFFFLGRECSSERAADADAGEVLSSEASEHGDLLIADFCEHYLNLTLKTLLMIEWASAHCAAASYLVKIDSDVYLHVGRLRELLLLPPPENAAGATAATTVTAHSDGVVARQHRREIIGKMSSQHVPSRSKSSKWYMPHELFDGLYYPAFAYGPCYALSIDLLADLVAESKRYWYLPYEDVFVTGVCAKELSAVTRRSYDTFIANRCEAKGAIAVHWYSCWHDRPIELQVLFANEATFLRSNRSATYSEKTN